MKCRELLQYFDDWLNPASFPDAAHNGLQIEGNSEIEKILFGVSANLELIKKALKENAQAIFVHHGLFWSPGLMRLSGFMKERVKLLLENNINLFAYHLPLDAHPTLGNNAQIFNALNLPNSTKEPFGYYKNHAIGFMGCYDEKVLEEDFLKVVENAIGPVNFKLGKRESIQKVAICSGKAPDLIYQAIDANADVFICGEATEWITSIASESNILFIAAGHHRTEVFGPKAILSKVKNELGLKTSFLDTKNPV